MKGAGKLAIRKKTLETGKLATWKEQTSRMLPNARSNDWLFQLTQSERITQVKPRAQGA